MLQAPPELVNIPLAGSTMVEEEDDVEASCGGNVATDQRCRAPEVGGSSLMLNSTLPASDGNISRSKFSPSTSLSDIGVAGSTVPVWLCVLLGNGGRIVEVEEAGKGRGMSF